MDKEDRVVLGNLPSVKLDSPTIFQVSNALCVLICVEIPGSSPNRRFLLGRLFTDLKIAGLTQPQNWPQRRAEDRAS